MSGQEPTRKRGGAAPVAGPHPAPEVLCREAAESEIPQAPRLMRNAATAAGWAVQVTYARGTVMHRRTGKPTRVVNSVAVRIVKSGVRGWAVWHGGRFDTAQIWEPDVCVWPRNVGATEFAARVTS